MKYEWKKQEKELYLPDDIPMLITVPMQKFFAIKGKGNPNEADFAERIGVLYSLAYAVRMIVNNLVRSTDNHREIYLSDINKIEREKLKTILRYSVNKK